MRKRSRLVTLEVEKNACMRALANKRSAGSGLLFL
jgi:hypothetical protein